MGMQIAERTALRTQAEGAWRQTPALALTRAEDEQVIANLALVRWIAGRVASAIPVQVELEDLVQTGILGLIDAIRRFDPEKGIPFPAYARYRIRGAILDALRGLDWATRSQRHQRKLPASASASTAPPAASVRIFSLSVTGASPLHNERMDPLPPPEIACDERLHPDRLYERREARDIVDRALSTLPERHRLVMLMYYSGDWSMREIGRSLGVNESRVSQIHKAALCRMKRALADEVERSNEARAQTTAVCA
jgi:RNA polymerase sigma factor for flagellar operon FliA